MEELEGEREDQREYHTHMRWKKALAARGADPSSGHMKTATN